MIKATCKICGFEKEFEVKYAGKSFKCPSCTSPVKIEINEIVAEPKKVNVDITNIPIPTTNTKSEKKSNKIIYIILASFVLILFTIFIYNKGTKDNTEITIIDSPVDVNVVKPDEYWKSKEGNNTKQYEIGYYKKKYQGSEYGIIYENSDGAVSANQYLYDDVIIKIDKVVNGYGYISYNNSNNILSYGWVKMEELDKSEDPNIIDIAIDDAKDQYLKFYDANFYRDKSSLYDLYSSEFENYMGKVNYTKDQVYDDASKYMDRWKLISEELNEFTKFSKNKFTYTKRITVTKVDDETIMRIFDVEGIIGFDSEMKINYLNDTKTTRIN